MTERSGRAVFADILNAGRNRIDDQSATTFAEHEAEASRSVMVAVNRLAEESAAATAGRVSRVLDHLTAEGVLEENDRVRFAADQATRDLDRLVRTAEVAGHDPADVVRAAVAQGDFSGARSVAQVLHSRITESLRGRLTPAITSAGPHPPRRRRRHQGAAGVPRGRRRRPPPGAG